jgi:hypothetical protein
LLVQNIDLTAQNVYPFSALMQGSDGRLYGGGGTYNSVTDLIYAIDAGLPPPVPSIAGSAPPVVWREAK